jgi:hypothetical protein
MELDAEEPAASLSYDDTLPYEDQQPATGSLADRIGQNKVYLLSETTGRSAKGANKVCE